MSTPKSTGSKDQLTNLALLALAGGVVLIAALRAAGSITAWLSGQPEPAGGIGAGARRTGSSQSPRGRTVLVGRSPGAARVGGTGSSSGRVAR